MVDVKKVTATIKKPIYYENQNSTVPNEVINFNPANNPTSPISSSTVYTIDPFALFIQEDSSLKVKIPFTRFYRFKYAITPTSVYTSTSTTPDSFSVSKPIPVCSEALKIKRTSSGTTVEIQENVYNQNGIGLITYDPTVNESGVITGYTPRQILTAAIIEGIVELYAGDILTFEHTRVVFKKSDVVRVSGGLVVFLNIDQQPSPYLPRSAIFDLSGYVGDGVYPITIQGISNNSATVNPDIFRANASFFFEISEITDL